MNTLLRFIGVAGLCLAVVSADAGTRGRNNAQGGSTQTQGPARQHGGQRPGGPGNQGNPGGPRPGGPGNQGNPGGQRPGGPGNQGNPGGQRPGNQGNPGGQRPGNPGNPGGPGNRPGPQPNYGYHHGPGGYGAVPPRMPYRPYMPARPMPFRAPAPPPGYRPAPGVSLFGSILGVAVGTAINVSLDYLLGNGYTVSGYTNNAVYINNVTELNMMWPNATLFYGTGGALIGSEFVYSTPYYDNARYNMAYRYLTASYGAPVSTAPLQGGGMRVNWFGYNGQYVSLQYQPATAYDGSYRYYTTLSFGM